MLRNLRQGGHISTKSLEGIKQESYVKFAELLVTLWESVKTESMTYKKVETAFLASNSGPKGLLLKNHSKRHWEFVSPSTNRQTYYRMKSFFDFLISRNEPTLGWEVWSVLIFSEQRRSELLDQYDERVLRQQRLQKQKEANPIAKSHFNSFVTSQENFSEQPAWQT